MTIFVEIKNQIKINVFNDLVRLADFIKIFKKKI